MMYFVCWEPVDPLYTFLWIRSPIYIMPTIVSVTHSHNKFPISQQESCPWIGREHKRLTEHRSQTAGHGTTTQLASQLGRIPY